MSRKILLVVLSYLAASVLYAQELDPVTKWATIASAEFQISPNIVYLNANTVDLRLDVITAGSPTVPRPTLVYFHGGGWLEGTKESTLVYMLPYLAKGMNTVNVEYRLKD